MSADFPVPQMPALGVRAQGFGWRHPGRRHWALRDLDLRIEPGERVLVTGSSGSGKSTLLWALAGLTDAAQAGELAGGLRLRTEGGPVFDPRDVRSHIGLLLQDPDSNLFMGRAGDDVAFGLENARLPHEQIGPRVSAALAQVGFRYRPDRPTSALSGGEKQRVALAGLLAGRPSLLLMDEPTANLDPDGAHDVLRLTREVLAESGATLVLVEHRVDLVSQIAGLADRLIVLTPSGVAADGPLAQVCAEQANLLRQCGVAVPGRSRAVGLPAAPARRGEPVLLAQDVSVVRGRGPDPVLIDASIRVPAGGAVALMGQNGAGKSTFARVLGGLLAPSAGRAWSAVEPGTPLHRMRSRRLAALVGNVFQEPEHQFLAETAQAELVVGARATGRDRLSAARAAGHLLDQLGLSALARANPYTLSGGEKRRLAVAAALCANPGALVLDEPTFGQDANTWREIARLLIDQLDAGRALVVVTHDRDLVAALGASTVQLAEGRVLPPAPSGITVRPS